MKLDLIIAGGTVVTADATFKADVGVRGGRIAYVGDVGRRGSALSTLDVSGLHVLPGLIDGHVHMRDPGMPTKEDFASGTKAAAFGGFTTVVDMPNTVPAPLDAASLVTKARAVSPRAFVDFGLTALLSSGNAAEVLGLRRAGALGFNVFNGVEVAGSRPPDDGELWELMRRVARTGLPLGLLPENQLLVQAARLRQGRRGGVRAWLSARTTLAESQAIAAYVPLARDTGCRIHINHLSSGEGLETIIRARRSGVRITCETSPHQLLLTRSQVLRLGRIARVSPPLRSDADRDALWQGLRRGDVDMIVSDHAPHAIADRDRADLWAPSVTGFSGVELAVPAVLTEMAARQWPLKQLVRLMSTAPAEFFGIYPRKGSLIPGADADITVVDAHLTRTVDPARLHSRSALTPFVGRVLTGWPRFTVVRGRLVVADGEVAEVGGFGQWIRTRGRDS